MAKVVKSRAQKRKHEDTGPTLNTERQLGEHDLFFKWLLGITQHEFFQEYFEQKPLHFSHGSSTHFRNPPKGFPAVEWSTDEMLNLASKKRLSYSTDLNVVRFDNKINKRVSYRNDGHITSDEMRLCMKKGWSIRFLRPHEHVSSNSAVISKMEDIFCCFCGLNSYWTPANSQGFAPHYDDVDVFLLQLEGEKEWNLYTAPSEVDVLSRYSSEDYNPKDLPPPIMTLRLVPGDVLYMPRGTVHQGRTLGEKHSLHVTFSANQMNTWADLIKIAVTHSLEKLATNEIIWRKSLPRTTLKTLGAIYHPVFREENGLLPLTEKYQKRRRILQSVFREKVAELSLLLSTEETIDECCDLYAKETVTKLQPPPKSTIKNDHSMKEITGKTIVRLVSSQYARLIFSVSGEVQLYHSGKNSPICLAAPVGLLRFEVDFAPALATLLASGSRGIQVSTLPFPAFDNVDDIYENQLTLVKSLYDANIITIL
ncbi:lysine-specific demethylase NO66 [Trypanosoma theileri]|uniref:Bifunctional lysine-specific demethylase and histidyl-hydroxylase n=1 Tax=Trypanosoma theileri TaxID=67003 RepID=A0A1X0NJI1_9TRYP|nr:lysine-specific demethylase NO66 [Trypanosoma theileri]ORC84751.1 lysine-specific demethylase NO66 [Trypanosoma theileri]